MLIPESEWSSRRARSEKFEAAMHRLRQDVAGFLSQPVAVPSEPAGYYHDYFCPEHGVQLKFDPVGPADHRCPVDGARYRGPHYDAAWRWSVNNLLSESAIRLAVLWKLEGDGACFDRVVEILRGYATHYPDHLKTIRPAPNPGVATYTTLDESVWILPLAWAFDMVRSSLSEGDSKMLADRLFIPAADHLVEHHYGAVHNFACWHNAAIGTIGLVLDRQDLVEFAVQGRFGFDALLREGVRSDGLWFEGSFSYHFYALAGLLALAKAAHWSPDLDLADRPALRSMFLAPVQCAYPDGSLPATNDCWYFTGLTGECCHGVPPAPAFYEIGYAWYGDPRFAQVLHSAYDQGSRDSLDALIFGKETIPQGGLQPLSSTHLPGSGYAILRHPSTRDASERPGNEDRDQRFLFLKYGPHGGSHGHPDKLNLILYDRGRRFCPDLGTPGYGIDLNQSWYRQTLSHNTVMVDGLSQPPAEGSLKTFRDKGPFQVADASVVWDDGPYEGISMRRVVLARAEYFLDLFLVESDRVRQIDWIYRNAGVCDQLLGASPFESAEGEGKGYEHIFNARIADADSDVICNWQLNGAGLKLWTAGMSGTRVITGQAPGNPPADLQGITIYRRHATATAFASVFHPHEGVAPVASVVWAGRDLVGTGWIGCGIELDNIREHWLIRQTPDTVIPPEFARVDGQFEYCLEE